MTGLDEFLSERDMAKIDYGVCQRATPEDYFEAVQKAIAIGYPTAAYIYTRMLVRLVHETEAF